MGEEEVRRGLRRWLRGGGACGRTEGGAVKAMIEDEGDVATGGRGGVGGGSGARRLIASRSGVALSGARGACNWRARCSIAQLRRTWPTCWGVRRALAFRCRRSRCATRGDARMRYCKSEYERVGVTR